MIIVDVETTGVSAEKNCIVSIGAVDYDSDREFYQECIIYPESEVTPIALEINGFTEDDIRNSQKPEAKEAYGMFEEWSLSLYPENKDKPVLAGHNVGHFDILFLEKENSRILSERKFPFSYRTVDSHTLGVLRFGKSLTLDGLLEACGLSPEPKPHNALTGAKSCKEALKSIFAHYLNK